MEDKDVGMKDLIKGVTTRDLIAELRTRELTESDVSQLQSLKPTEAENVQVVSEVEIENDQPIEIDSNVERFVKLVERKNSYGKLPKGSTTDGKPIENLGGGFYDHGPDNLTLPRTERGVRSITSNLYAEQNNFPEQMESHIVSVAPSDTDPSITVLTIRFFQDKKQIDGRGSCTPAYVSVEMPSTSASEFIGEAQSNPDLLEAFYQKVFVGLDSTGDRPGMRRLQATGFYLVQDDKLAKAQGFSPDADISSVKNFFDSLPRYNYSNGPYGSGETFQPK